MKVRLGIARCLLTAVALVAAGTAPVYAVHVPGTGQKVDAVGDDFEDPDWTYIPNNPKSSLDIDKQTRPPAGRSKNGRWRENLDRGHPDVVKRIATPEGGLPGSEGALLLASKATGIPGHPTRKGEQDDLFMNVNPILRHYVPVSQGPSVVVRVYVPPFEEWEDRTGSSFAVRATLRGINPEKKDQTEPYWPGIFVNYKRPQNRRKNEAPAQWVVRASKPGGDFTVRPLTEPGWYTLGMSFTSDGMVHYFIRQGVEDLRPRTAWRLSFLITFRPCTSSTCFLTCSARTTTKPGRRAG